MAVYAGIEKVRTFLCRHRNLCLFSFGNHPIITNIGVQYNYFIKKLVWGVVHVVPTHKTMHYYKERRVPVPGEPNS